MDFSVLGVFSAESSRPTLRRRLAHGVRLIKAVWNGKLILEGNFRFRLEATFSKNKMPGEEA